MIRLKSCLIFVIFKFLLNLIVAKYAPRLLDASGGILDQEPWFVRYPKCVSRQYRFDDVNIPAQIRMVSIFEQLMPHYYSLFSFL